MPPSRFQFGRFEADLKTGELYREGHRIALQQQPFAVLRLLLARPGEIVTRDELRQALWPSDTFVDFEAGLNAAIKRVRHALDDSADHPRFVATYPRRGYSFIAPVSTPEAACSPTRPKRAFWAWTGGATVLVAIVGTWFRPVLAVPPVAGLTALTAPLAIPLNQNLVTDGPSVFFTRVTAGGIRELVKVPARGGPVVPVELPADFRGNTTVLDISSDGAEILVSERIQGHRALWTIPAEGGPPQRLGNLESDGAAWFPDGNGVTYAQGNNLYTADRSGEHVQLLLRTPGEAMNPRWSPDRKQLRYTVYDRGTNRSRLWDYDAVTRVAHPLEPRASAMAAAVWSADGRYYLFSKDQPPGVIWARRETAPFWRRTAGAATALTSGPVSYSSPIPSRDGQHLYAIGAMDRGELLHLDRNTKQWQPYLNGISADALTFSPDGSRVAYISYPERSLWSLDQKTGNRLQLVGGPGHCLMPQWSPDGSAIAYTWEVGGLWQLKLVTSNGSRVTTLTGAGLDAGQATWAPSGKQLALVYRHIPKDEPQRLGIFDLATRRLTDVPASQNWGFPQWSPDGKFLLARKPGPDALALFSFADQRWRAIPTSDWVKYPRWSRDGRSFIYNTLGGKRPGIYRMRLLDATATRFGPAELMANLSGFVPTGSYGDWSGLDPTGDPLLMRFVGGSAIYRLDWPPR